MQYYIFLLRLLEAWFRISDNLTEVFRDVAGFLQANFGTAPYVILNASSIIPLIKSNLTVHKLSSR